MIYKLNFSTETVKNDLIQCNKQETVSALSPYPLSFVYIVVIRLFRLHDFMWNVVEAEAYRHDNRLELVGSLLLPWPMGVKSYGLGLKAAYGGGVVFFQYLLWANKQE